MPLQGLAVLAAARPGGRQSLPVGALLGFECRFEAVVRGDAMVREISAASILAKVARDAWMTHAAAVYPDYGFEQHKGYPTARHFGELARVGPCRLHRRSFAPVKSGHAPD